MNPWGPIAQLSKEEIRDVQNRKLHHFLNRYLYPFSPHYQNLFKQNKIDSKKIKSQADLKDIPFTSKLDFIDPENPDKVKDFVQQPDKEKFKQHWPLPELLKLKLQTKIKGEEYIKDRLKKEFRPCFITFTTGTTNCPVSFLYTGYDIQNLHVSGARMLKLFDIKDDEYIVNMFPYAPHLAVWQVVFGGLASSVLILSTGGGKVMGTTGNISAIEKMRPSVILGVPSYVYHVLRVAKESGCELNSIKKVVLGASKVTEGFKLKLAELLESMGALDASIFGTYGFTEARTAWGECPTKNDISSGYHLYPDKEIFEVVDPKTGEVKGEGEDGELVYTSIDSRGSSVLRYRTGDFVEGGISYDPCPHCGLTVPRISSKITRISDVKDMKLTKVKGALVNFNHFNTVLSDFAQVDEWQIELCKKDNDPFEVDQLVIYISCKEDVNKKSLTDAIKKQFMSVTEVTPNEIKFIPLVDMVERLELEIANKEKRIIDNRPKD